MATQRALLLKVKPSEMLKNTISAGSSVSSCSESCRFELWVEGARGKSWHQPCAQQRAQRTRVQPGDTILRDIARAKNSAGRAQTFMHLRLCRCKSPRIPLFGVPPPEAPVQAVILLLPSIILRIQTSETQLWESLD